MRRHARPNGKYITLRDAEREYGLPYHKLYRWVDRGLIPRLSRDATGTSIYVKREDLDRFLAENTSEARS
jgi:hypothetical protein